MMSSILRQSLASGGLRRVLGILAAGACLAGCLATGGCYVLGAALYKVSPPPKVQAVYTLPKEPILVWVENYRNPGVSDQDAERLGRQIADQFKKHKIAPVIDPDKFFEYRFDRGNA